MFSVEVGGYGERVTPVPIPNTEVKPLIADGTARVAVWESRTLPTLQSFILYQKRLSNWAAFFASTLWQFMIQHHAIHGEEYGMARITNSLKNIPDASADEILAYMTKDFFEFAGTDTLSDDFTVILLKRIS